MLVNNLLEGTGEMFTQEKRKLKENFKFTKMCQT